jgi:hypothetical protein
MNKRPLRFGPGPLGDFTPPEDIPAEPRTTLSDGTQIYPEHRRLRDDGQQEGYVVLAEEERAKGFVRPVRRSYTHLKCGNDTTMGQTIAETYARNPKFYSGTFCCACGAHFPVGAEGEFVWRGTNEKVGT